MANVELTAQELLARGPCELGSSQWLQIDQARIDAFADATDDHQWIHVDVERARAGPFGTTIAHGYLTLSLVPRMLQDIVRITDAGRGTNYGVDRVRFVAPVPVDAHLRLHGTLTSVTQRGDGGIRCTLRFEIEIRDADRPAAVGEIVFLRYADAAVHAGDVDGFPATAAGADPA